MNSRQRDVLDFWFRELTPQDWFQAGEKLDPVVRQRFGALVEEARAGALDDWAEDRLGRLALIILLDQFPRHIYRGTAQAFSSDRRAQQLALEGIAAGVDEQLAASQRHFFYMPLMHAEDPALQAKSMERFTALRDYADWILQFAQGHSDEIAQSGRFTGRDAALGRS
ncbi:DUF924 family protein [Novosphingobium beihaiensis]|uniref:DUF924 domain-containing protein n=1 Tax=Novosphingobium beihaiensis TaxID=2930389 RepID=A0ABT0BTY7_9SPHN|nr:DUF924 family protein [Novosphingobium beihaiensis]MCJ2188524.1 DUF924 domain-containing protein [Novosphingobium beihaiensis]